MTLEARLVEECHGAGLILTRPILHVSSVSSPILRRERGRRSLYELLDLKDVWTDDAPRGERYNRPGVPCSIPKPILAGDVGYGREAYCRGTLGDRKSAQYGYGEAGVDCE